jgi:chorismate dehydratase
MKKIKISAVSYLNTKPFVWGILHSELFNKIELSLDMPSLCAAKLKDDTVDIGLIPAAAIPEIKDAQIITDYCISSSGKVRTVVLASQVPLSEIKAIVLDYQSRTSVRLVQILANNYWEISPQWINGKPGYIQHGLKGTTAGVIIGDRVFEAEKKFRYIYDLGEEWQKMTGLDFVFACWVANKSLEHEFILEFNQALIYGQKHLPEVISEIQSLYPDSNLDEYFHENIIFSFDDSKRKGLELFLKFNENPELK